MGDAADFSEQLEHFGDEQPITLRRRPAALVVDGVARPQAEVVLQLVGAATYPANGREIQRLPEGMRTQEVRAVLSPLELHSGEDDRSPDRLEMDGELWEVQTVKHWRLGGYWEVLVTKVGR